MCVCMCTHMCMYVHACICMMPIWMSEDFWQQLVISYYASSWDGTQVIKLSTKYFYPLSHLACTNHNIFISISSFGKLGQISTKYQELKKGIESLGIFIQGLALNNSTQLIFVINLTVYGINQTINCSALLWRSFLIIFFETKLTSPMSTCSSFKNNKIAWKKEIRGFDCMPSLLMACLSILSCHDYTLKKPQRGQQNLS